MAEPTIFERIVAREIPAEIVLEDDEIIAFADIAPKAELHVLVVPKTARYRDVVELAAGDPDLLAAMVRAAKAIALERADGDFRLVFNTGELAGQTVFHVHAHVLAGADLTEESLPDAHAEIQIDGIQMVRLLGPQDRLLTRLEREYPDVTVAVRGNQVTLDGDADQVEQSERLVRELVDLVANGADLGQSEVGEGARLIREDSPKTLADVAGDAILTTGRKSIRAKTEGQRAYVDAIGEHTIVFGIGPAGTGKTYLAMAMAVQALQRREVQRIILTRPAVEAGERLGFLPGTLTDKIDPYLRPLYDALNEMMDPELVPKLLATGVVEVAPLAYMRGRTLNDAFVVLDEAQNTTPEQMKMFLTRLGFGSRMVVTGDITQIDLPEGTSGLQVASRVLGGIDDIHFAQLTSADVVRHTLVGRIVDAYTAHEARTMAQEGGTREQRREHLQRKGRR